AIQGQGHECYEYDTPGWPPYALFKVVFGLCTGLLTFRLLSFILFFGLTGLTVRVGTFFRRGSFMHRFCNSSFAVLSRMLCNLSACYVIQVFHAERLHWVGRPGRHPVVVPNHISMIEAFSMNWLTWVMAGCVAKSQLSIPGVGAAADFVNGVVVDTKDPNVKEKVNAGILQYVNNQPDEKGKLPHSKAFVIYPEGVTNSQRGLFRFNTGAFTPGQPVQPIVQRFPYKFMQVKVCEIWEPNEAEKADPFLFAGNVQNYMGLQLGIPVTSTSNKILREAGGPFDLKKQSQVQPENGDADRTIAVS
ncbi:unnamed protein product, partial [Effrenium voratum]